ncbi:MAG TPA: adenosylcobinamide-phosphate synthase CbiB [Nocardioidaceae bacterium]|nr:adenosylcobinamide-phosphate synthase CbiB [Nocardioidaceae bacterium]
MSRALGLVLGYAADQLFGDPRRFHPVAGFGVVASALERQLVSTRSFAPLTSRLDRRTAGIAYTGVLVGGAAAMGGRFDGTVPTALATYAVLGGRSLAREATAVHDHLQRGDLDAAREQVTHLVGRNPSQLGPDDIARATVESVAENTSDAVVAPLFWGAVAGPAGLLGYRAANTLDAMVGHRTPRHEQFGWASARFDDALNLAPARLAAALAAAAGGNPRDAVNAWRRDAPQHPSPNAGPVEASFAGSLGLQLGGTNVYAGGVEDRGHLGHGKPPTVADIPRANRLAARVGWAALGVSVLLASRPRRQPS